MKNLLNLFREKTDNPQGIELGDLVKDRLSGFTGVVECISYWLNACERVTIRPDDLDKEGKLRDPYTFDGPQVVVLEKGYYDRPKIPKGHKTGGPSIAPSTRSNPER